MNIFFHKGALLISLCSLLFIFAFQIDIASAAPPTINNLTSVPPGLSPSSAVVGSNITLTVNGTGFTPSSIVHLGSMALSTTYVSSTVMTASFTVPSAGQYSVTVVNPGTSATTAGYPLSVLVSPDGNRVYVMSVFGEIQAFDASNLTQVASTRASGYILGGTRSLAISPDGNYLYAISVNVWIFNSGSYIEKFRTSDLVRVASGYSKGYSTAIAISPDGNHLYISNFYSHLLEKLNASNLSQAVAPVSANYLPYDVTVSSNGEVYIITATNFVQRFTANLSSLPPSGTTVNWPQSFSVNNNSVFILSNSANRLQKYNLTLNQPPTTATPDGYPMSVTTNNNFVYVTNYNTSTLQKFNASNLTEAETHVSAPLRPIDIDVSSDGSYAYVVSYTSKSVQKYTTSPFTLDGGTSNPQIFTAGTSAPGANNLSVSGASCPVLPGETLVNFSWNYQDSDGDNEKQFQLQVVNSTVNPTFNPSLSFAVDRTFNNLSNAPGSLNQQTASVKIGGNEIDSLLFYNKTYYWRVKVWETNPGGGVGLDSGFVNGSNYTTINHPAPYTDFTFSGNALNVNFTDTSICYNSAGVTSCQTPWDWDFSYDGSTYTVESTVQNPSHTYGAPGTSNVALRVYDPQNSALYCTKIKPITVPIGSGPGVPKEWKEISPFNF